MSIWVVHTREPVEGESGLVVASPDRITAIKETIVYMVKHDEILAFGGIESEDLGLGEDVVFDWSDRKSVDALDWSNQAICDNIVDTIEEERYRIDEVIYVMPISPKAPVDKKKMTGYNLFVQDKVRNDKVSLPDASKMWSVLSNELKTVWKNKAAAL